MRGRRFNVKWQSAARRAGILLLLVACGGGIVGATIPAGAAPIVSIRQIPGGQTLDFDALGNPASLFTAHQMQLQTGLVLNGPSDGFDPWVTGNIDAPASEGNVWGTFRVRTTGAPWSAIGASAAHPAITLGLDQPSAEFRIRAFDQAGLEIGSLTRTFHASPEDTSLEEIHHAYNAAVLFLGLGSSTPIYSVEFSRVNGQDNVYWDSLTFLPVPEPSAAAVAAMMLGGLAAVSSRRRRRTVGTVL